MTEKAMRIPLDNWSSYESSLTNQQPIFTKTTINVVIYLLGDWLSQTLFIKRNLLEFDAWRTLRNGFIGMVFGPLVHQYYEFSDYILPVDAAMINRVYKIIMDQTIYIFTKCCVYIVAVNMLAGESWEYSYEEARGKIKNIMFTAWKFWPLVHCVTYGAIPARHRILWVNCVDLFWNAILASLASGDEEASDDEEGDDEGTMTVVATNVNSCTNIATTLETVEDDHLFDTNGVENDNIHNLHDDNTVNIADNEDEGITLTKEVKEQLLTKDRIDGSAFHNDDNGNDEVSIDESNRKDVLKAADPLEEFISREPTIDMVANTTLTKT